MALTMCSANAECCVYKGKIKGDAEQEKKTHTDKPALRSPLSSHSNTPASE